MFLAGCSSDRVSSCEDIERDYLEAVSTQGRTASFGSTASNEELRAMAHQIEDEELKQLELSFIDLSDECGDRAAMIAHRKATEMVFDQ